ncbi:MAG: TolC family protein [Spirochaetia bacterium]
MNLLHKRNALLFTLNLFLPILLYSQSYSVQDVVTAGLEHSGQVEIARMEAHQAGIEADQARARRWPEIGFQLSSSYLTNPPEGITIHKGELGYAPSPGSEAPTAVPDQDYTIMEDPENTYFQLNLRMDQPLFTWGKIQAGIDAAEAGYRAASHELRGARESLGYDLRLAYFGIVSGRQTVDRLGEALEIMEEIVADNQRSYDEGLINLQSLLEARSRLAELEASYYQASEGLETAYTAVQYYSGLDLREAELTSAIRQELPDMQLEALTELAREHSPDLAALRQRHQQARINTQVTDTSGLFRPDFALNLNLELSGGRIPFVSPNWIGNWDANLIISIGTQMNVFDSGRSSASQRSAETSQAIAAQGVLEMEQGLQLQVRRSIEQVRSAYYAMLQRQAQMLYTREQARNAEVSYENELITRIERRSARLAFISSDISYIMSRYQYEQALQNLEYLIGFGLRENPEGPETREE